MKSKKLDASPIKNKINTINTTLPSIQSKPNFTQNEIYEHSVNLIKDTTILEFDAVYNEQYK